jgi:hypothetical protein
MLKIRERSGQNNKYLDVKDFNAGFWKLFYDLSATGTPNNHFDWILPTIRSLPEWMHRAMGMEFILTWEKVCSSHPMPDFPHSSLSMTY